MVRWCPRARQAGRGRGQLRSPGRHRPIAKVLGAAPARANDVAAVSTRTANGLQRLACPCESTAVIRACFFSASESALAVLPGLRHRSHSPSNRDGDAEVVQNERRPTRPKPVTRSLNA